MSGIYIHGMEMPKNCFLCKLSYLAGERLYCNVTHEEVLRAKIAPECPLVAVPDHGRLVDADVVEKEIERYEKISGYPVGEEPKEFTGDDGLETVRYTAWMARCFIAEQNAPTIIPAEEGE